MESDIDPRKPGHFREKSSIRNQILDISVHYEVTLLPGHLGGEKSQKENIFLI